MARILLAEDEQQIGDMVAIKLTNAGHDVVRVGDGEAALAAAARDRPDAHHPRRDDAAPGRIRGPQSPEGGPGPPRDPGDHAHRARPGAGRPCGLQSGAADYIVKPFSLKELLDRVDVVLQRR